MEDIPMKQILITSLISHRDQTPRIDITMPSARVQLSADEAMNVAHQIIECVQGSYADSFLWNWLQEQVFKGSKDERTMGILGQMLVDFREYRDKLRREFESYQGPEHP